MMGVDKMGEGIPTQGREMKTLAVHNPNGLPTIDYRQLVDFQGDLKKPIKPKDLSKIRNSLLKYGVFVPKFVWFDDNGRANIVDGHQTKCGLASLEADGWEIPEIPYIRIDADGAMDAAERLLQINSRYAEINPDTTWFESFEFPDLSELLETISIPELSMTEIPVEEIQDPSPDDFGEYDEGIDTEYSCPKCGYEWSGKPK